MLSDMLPMSGYLYSVELFSSQGCYPTQLVPFSDWAQP